jgi:hypothetical protein
MITEKIIFYDGHCNLCNGFVNAIIKLDKKNIFLFKKGDIVSIGKLNGNLFKPNKILI